MKISKWLYPIISLALPGCAALPEAGHLHCEAKYSSSSFQDITNFDYDGWQSAKAYPFRPGGLSSGAVVHEGGNVRFLWNEQYLFVLGDMEDSDIVQECDKDNQHLYLTGDLMEVFVKPTGQPSYWELFAAPNQRKSSYFYPSQGRRLPSSFTDFVMDGLVCKAKLDGTLNNYKVRSKGWKAIMAIPMPELEKSCGKLDFSSPWLVQVSRYNYSAYLDKCELSHIGLATLPKPDFHHFPSYVELEFVK